jgi:hypothetical protein
MSTAATVAKIVCSECQRENEAERVYCHDCGARLDRSAVIVQKEPVVDVHKRVRRMFDPTRARIRALFFKTSKMILGAGATSVFVVMFLPPDLPEQPKAEMLASQVRLDMESALQKHQPMQLEFSQDQVNAYLSSALKTKKTALNKPFLDFKRGVAQFHEGNCTITAERTINGLYPVFTSASYGVSIDHGKLVAKAAGGAIGRLQVHPKLMPYLEKALTDVFGALDSDSKLVAKFSSVEFHDKRATLNIAAP